jgi:tripartite-type tricarboxylate transporter receptor subunit TctC
MTRTLFTRRGLLTGAALLAALLAFPGPPWPRPGPSKPVTLVVPFPAGGTTDVLARALARSSARRWARRSSSRASPVPAPRWAPTYVAKSKPDGHTLLVGAVHHTIAAASTRSCPTTSRRTSRR